MNFLERHVFYYCCVGKSKMYTYYKIIVNDFLGTILLY